MEEKTPPTQYRWQILQKEIDLIDGTIKNLDDLIHKSKNFAWLMWGGSLFLIVGPLAGADVDQRSLIFATAIIPLLFWLMDFQWRRHLRYAGERQKTISRFINSSDFLEGLDDQGTAKFPLLDPVGWTYTRQTTDPKVLLVIEDVNPSYLIDREKFSTLRIAFYKDAAIYFLTMTVLSVIFGLLFA